MIDFVANWLLTKIKGAAGKVGEGIKSIAQKILARLKKVGSKVGGVVKRGAGKVMHALGNTRVGQAVKRGYETVRNTMNKGKARVEQWQKDRAAKKNAGKTPEQIAKEKHDKLQKAVTAIRPSLLSMLEKGSPKLLLNARLAFWKMRYGLTSLAVEGRQVTARVNPSDVIAEVVDVNKDLSAFVIETIHKVGREVLYENAGTDQEKPHSVVQQEVSHIQQQRAAIAAGQASGPIHVAAGHAPAAMALDWRQTVSNRTPWKTDESKVIDPLGGSGTAAVREGQGHRRSLGFVTIKSEGAIPSYPNLHTAITDLKATLAASGTPIEDADLAEAILAHANGRPLPSAQLRANPQATHLIAEMTHLLSLEGARGDAAISNVGMLMSMVRQDQMSFTDAFTGRADGRGLFPSSQQGAMASMRNLADETGVAPVEDIKSRATGTVYAEHRERQMKWIENYIRTEMTAKQLQVKDTAAVEKYIRDEFPAACRAANALFFGAAPATGTPAGRPATHEDL